MNRQCILAAALMMSVATPLQAQSVTAGIEAWQQSDYAKAVSIWMPLANKGDPDAQFNLGQAYRLGKGVQTNVAAAKTWFERAAGQGHVDAQTTLGLLLFQNGDQVGGLKWLKKAADQGEARAMLVYGTALVNGDGVPQDPILGYALVSGAASQGLAPAKQTLDQLDQLLPAADRKRALAMALDRPKPAVPPVPRATEVEPKPGLASANVSRSPAPKTTETAALSRAAPSDAPQAERVAVAKAAPDPARAVLPEREQVASVKPRPKPDSEVQKREPKPSHPETEKKLAAAKAEKKPIEAKASAPATGTWRIQLGAFGQRSNAEAMFKKVSGKDALDGRRAFYIPAGAVTRLQVGPFESQKAASGACKAVGVACFPVNSK